ncbi:hypothetical protein DPMN_000395 [Dreissena polymorpha]|uniref:Uncharacterized protein n=1 Tax=Dreissena polymorpha TaxID=45954 RepID=A0A9D4MIX1_DREPO|nr:hypothetical protein DPMN_000395 [Dreissena polymorpha]
MFPAVEAIYMVHNDMRFMNADKFVDNFSVLQLELTNNSFRQIPSGVNAFKSMYALNLKDNLIEFIKDNDLIGLRSLKEINLAGNPIQFITNRAFQNNMQLTDIYLSHTLLTTIPSAVTMLPDLHYLFIEDNNIECTFELASLKNWTVSSTILLASLKNWTVSSTILLASLKNWTVSSTILLASLKNWTVSSTILLGLISLSRPTSIAVCVNPCKNDNCTLQVLTIQRFDTHPSD